MRRLLLLSLPLALLAGAASALTTTHAATPPAGPDLVLAWDSATYLGGHPLEHGSSIALNVGQTFRLTQPVTLDRVTFKLRALTDIAPELVTIWIGSYTDPTDSERNELLRVEYGSLPADLPIDEVRYVTFDLTYPVALAANQQYGVVIGFTGGGGVNNARAEVLHLGDDLYAGGTALTEYGSFTSALEEDLVFYLQGGSEPPPPPPTPDPDEQLLLRDGRFQVDVYWRTLLGSEGFAQPVVLTTESGSFWFFGENNLEIFIKVLDACAEFDRYWVFLAGLTDVEVLVTVRDLQAEATWSFFNPMGQPFPPVLDASAFTTCP